MLSRIIRALRGHAEPDAALREALRIARSDLRARERELMASGVALANARLTIEAQRRELEALRAEVSRHHRWH